MSNWEQEFTEWINYEFNDYYVMLCPTFEDGFKIVDHHQPVATKSFIQLIHNLFPWTKDNPTPFSQGAGRFTLFIDGVQLTIKPYDDEIHHTEYVKEE